MKIDAWLGKPRDQAIDESGRRGSGVKWISACLLIIVAVSIPLVSINQSLWIDEAGSIAQASARDFIATARRDVHPPLYFAVLRFGLHLTSSFALLRLFSVACGLGILGVALFSFRKSASALLVAGGVAVALPELVTHSTELRPYALLYLLLAGALSLAGRACLYPAEKATRFGLAAVLAIAAATHLITAIFIIGLVPLIYWPTRGKGFRSFLLSFLPFVPAGLLLFWFKYGFVTNPENLREGWWLPATSAPTVLAATADVFGWREIEWFSSAVQRRSTYAGSLIPYVSAGALILTAWSAWGYRKGEALRFVLLTSAGAYFSAIIIYSVYVGPIILPRTLLPGVLFLVASVAVGIGSNPVGRRRVIGVSALLLYLTVAISPTVRRSLTPPAGLRGLAFTILRERKESDVVLLLRSLDFGLAPYGVSLGSPGTIYLDQARVTTAQLSAFERQFEDLKANARVLVAYRDDYYWQQHREVLTAIIAALARHGRTVKPLWQEGDLRLLASGTAVRE